MKTEQTAKNPEWRWWKLRRNGAQICQTYENTGAWGLPENSWDLFISHKRGPFGPGQKEIHILITGGEKHNQTNAKKLEKQMEYSIGIICSTLWRKRNTAETDILLVRCEMI